jgi:Domain of unknown function (DUF4185)
MRRRGRGLVGGALAVALGWLAACASFAGNGGSGASWDEGAGSDAGGSASSSGAGSSGSTGSSSSGSIGNGSSGSSGGTDSGGTGSDGGSSSSGALPPAPIYEVTPAPEWNAVFDNTGHTGDGFEWIPLGIKNRQGLGTASTNSAVFFDDSNYAGHFFNSTAGEYTGGITPDTTKIAWFYGSNGQMTDTGNMWNTNLAESGYGGTVAWNLVNNYGMSGIRGIADTHDTDSNKMWLSASSPASADSYVTLDSYGVRNLGKMYLWNFGDPGNTNKGLKNIKVYTSADGSAYTEYTGSGYPFQVPQASGSGPSGYDQLIDLNGASARYVKITYNPVSGDGNWGAPDMYGLSAVRIYDPTGNKLLLSAKAGSTATRNAYMGDPWGESAFSLGNYVYFVMHNSSGCCTPFEATATQLMRYTIVNGKVDWSTLTAFDSLPYMYYPVTDDAKVGNFYRVVQFENMAFWDDDDGYVYMLGADETNEYGIWSDKSNLVLSRVPSGSFEDFNARQYWNGSGWVAHYEDATDLTDVTGSVIGPVGNMPGYFKAQGGQLNGKYVLVYMEGVNGNSYFRYADNPSGPWSTANLLLQATVTGTPMSGDTIYNTGAVPFISNTGEFYFYLILNSSSMQFYKYSEIPPQASLSTGFETADPQPSWSDTVDFSSSVSGYQAGLNPQCSVRTGEQDHSGTSALMYSGTADGAGDGGSTDCYYDVFAVNIAVTSATVLDYWIYPQQDNGRYVAVDFHCTDGSTLRDSGAVDQNGISVHPDAGHGGNIPLNAWSEIRSNVGAKLAGKVVDKILVGYDRPGSSGQYRGYIDDLSIQ